MLQLCNFDDYKSQIKPHIEAIAERSNYPSLYSEVEQSFSEQAAFLVMKGSTFAILKPIVEKSAPKLLVWVTYGKSGREIKTHLPQIKLMARDIGAQSLQFWTNIKGMQRMYPRLGASFVRKQDQFEIWEITVG
jgi:hypothetical protein